MLKTLPLYQVDAFADRPFTGNPAAVCILEDWLSDELMLSIAAENNLSETAFIKQEGNNYRIRWFTPVDEVDLCGHATLAAAHVMFKHLNWQKTELIFESRSGALVIHKQRSGYAMDFPLASLNKTRPSDDLCQALGLDTAKHYPFFESYDWLLILDNVSELKALTPDFHKLSEFKTRGIIVSSPGEDCDYVARCFYPALGIDEDPVTGSAHCIAAAYWSDVLNKTLLSARQLSQRGGALDCEIKGERIILTGQVADYLVGNICIS